MTSLILLSNAFLGSKVPKTSPCHFERREKSVKPQGIRPLSRTVVGIEVTRQSLILLLNAFFGSKVPKTSPCHVDPDGYRERNPENLRVQTSPVVEVTRQSWIVLLNAFIGSKVPKTSPCHFACLPWQERRVLSAVAEEICKASGLIDSSPVLLSGSR